MKIHRLSLMGKHVRINSSDFLEGDVEIQLRKVENRYPNQNSGRPYIEIDLLGGGRMVFDMEEFFNAIKLVHDSQPVN